MRLILCLFGALALLCAFGNIANAQGCGPSNPNCIVPTAPFGTNNNQAASTAFVQQNGADPAAVYTGISGDCTATSLGVITCTKTNGEPFYTDLPSPVNPMDAATKQYVDNTAVGLVPHTQVRLGTTTALAANTYNNGTAGVGATLTGNSNGALTIDGVSVNGADRVVIKNEATDANNGIYFVTAAGDGSDPYVLTRATDANTPGTGNPNEIGFGTYVLVTAGSTNANTGWSVNSTVTTIGTDPIDWVQFSGAAGVSSLNNLIGPLSITAGTNITVTPGGSNIAIATTSNVATLNTVDQTLSGGVNVTSNNLGTFSSGTKTVDCGKSPLQYFSNNGAFTLAAPAADGSCILSDTNAGSAGTITFSGFTVGGSTGDPLTTTNTNKFFITVARINGVSTYIIKALQ